MSTRASIPAETESSSAGSDRLATAIAALITAACVAFGVTFLMDDPDVWQHLLVGKAIWQLHAIPNVHLWSWPTYGVKEVLPSWGFRALLWPFWLMGEATGLQIWRWITTLGAFAILWRAVRRMGAKGMTPFVVIAIAALVYRGRSQVRPETLAAVLLALELWILETRRHAGGRDHSLWLIPISCVWANVHLSYFIGLGLIVMHLIGGIRGSRATADDTIADPLVGASSRRLLLVALLSIAVSFLNPFGWRALWQPFDFFLHGRSDPIYQTVIELGPIHWSAMWKTGLPLLIAGWPLLIVGRLVAGRLDLVEALVCVAFTVLAFAGQRFLGFYALAATPYMARDLDQWIRLLRLPSWTRPAGARVALVSVACIGVGLFNWFRADYPIGIGFQPTQYPSRACDFITANGIHGNGFNPYYLGGYQLWRFWPARDRLPFMDIHQSGTPEDRRIYPYVFANHDAWVALDGRHSFDYILLDGHQQSVGGDRLLDFLDADSTWALVFRDDAGAVFVRIDGPHAELARTQGYRVVPAGYEKLDFFARAYRGIPGLRPLFRAEIARQLASSPWNGRAHMLEATLDWMDGDRATAEKELAASLTIDPTALNVHRQLGLLEGADGRFVDAAHEFEKELAVEAAPGDLHWLIAQSYMKAREWKKAREALQLEIRANPGNAAAKESLNVAARRMAR
jgi:hypothetical protein